MENGNRECVKKVYNRTKEQTHSQGQHWVLNEERKSCTWRRISLASKQKRVPVQRTWTSQ